LGSSSTAAAAVASERLAVRARSADLIHLSPLAAGVPAGGFEVGL
jgi:hypothetical protein